MSSIAVFLVIALPWLNPFSWGPSPGVVPLLFSWACAAALLALCSRAAGAAGAAAGHRVTVTAMAWLVAALLSAGLGLLQYFGASAVFGSWVSSTALGEAFANLRQRNQFATLTNIGLAALLWGGAQALPASPGGAARPARFAWPAALSAPGMVLLAALLATGNAASASRTGLVQLLLVLALAWLWGGWRQPALRRVLAAAVLAYAVAAFALPVLAGLDPSASGILARLRDGTPPCASRLTLWGNVLHLIAQKPWFGWGWDELDYAHFITLYPGARFCEILDNAHNLPLHLAVELGVPLALAVCGTGLWLVWRARPWRELDATRQLAWAVLALILLHSLLEYPLWYGPFQMAFGLCLWLLWRSSPGPVDTGAAPPAGHRAGQPLSEKYASIRPLARYLYTPIVMFLIAFTVYAGWDYYRINQIYIVPEMRSGAYRDNTLEKIGDSKLFQNQVRFAALTITPLTPGNAVQLRDLGLALLHFSPEPRVLEKLIESAVMLGRKDEALFYLVRYQAAFPQEHARWVMKPPL